jgi:hypothetical protein
MSSAARRVGILVFVFAAMATWGVGHPALFWLTFLAGIAYAVTCVIIHRFLHRAALRRHHKIREESLREGLPKEELNSFDRLPPEIIADDYKSVPGLISKVNSLLLPAGVLLLVLGLLLRLFC